MLKTQVTFIRILPLTGSQIQVLIPIRLLRLSNNYGTYLIFTKSTCLYVAAVKKVLSFLCPLAYLFSVTLFRQGDVFVELFNKAPRRHYFKKD